MPFQRHQSGPLYTSVRSLRNDWCLYALTILPFEKVFYLGVCKLVDVYKFPDAYRNTHFRETLTENSHVAIEIIGMCNEQKICYDELMKLRNELKPDANVRGYIGTGKTVVTCTLGANAGVSYETGLQAALMNGISQGALSNHLNGRPGYDVVKGMKFIRGLGR